MPVISFLTYLVLSTHFISEFVSSGSYSLNADNSLNFLHLHPSSIFFSGINSPMNFFFFLVIFIYIIVNLIALSIT